MGSIVAGLVLIGIGVAIGDSIFMGTVSLTSVIFDGLGLFFVAKGALGMYRERSGS